MIITMPNKPATVRHFVTFDKAELGAILSLYSFQVSKGHWRDYAIDFLKQMAVFSIFRHTAEQPIATVTKLPGNTATGFIYEVHYERKRLARNAELRQALDTLAILLGK